MQFNKDELVKSPLNYVGGKFKLLPQILPLFPDDIDLFVDLFAGDCDVGINVKAKKVLCNDYQYQLIDFYTYLQNNSVEDVYNHIYKRIEDYGLSKTNKDGYLAFRKFYNEHKNPLDFYILLCHSFNNNIRFNSKGEFNVPFGMNRSEFNKNLQERLKVFIEKIQKINFTKHSFEYLRTDRLSKNSFIYCDPPYLITTANYNENGGWGEELEYSLLNMLDKVNDKGIRFALSNVLEHKGKSNDILKEWAIKYNIHILDYDYSNCSYATKVKTKNSSIEVLITNY